jgi:GWxTD domain-containing protein
MAGEKRVPVQGNFSFTLKPGSYHALFEVNDLESRRGFVDRDPEITLQRFGDSAQVFSSLLFLDRLEIENDSLATAYPVNLGGGRDTSGTVLYSIHRFDDENKRLIALEDSAKPNPRLENRNLEAPGDVSSLMYLLRPSRTSPRVDTYAVVIHADTLPWGRYDIEVRGSGGAVRRKGFAIRWVDMPRTLRNTQLATEGLQYLMSENDFDDFMRLSNDEKRKAFEIFWKKRDPTPQTAYNEEMAEYYNRCDYAMENFGTLRQPDGIKADRGKIYILYGPPTSTDRVLNPSGAPQETWYYDNLQLRFIFIDQSRSGNYKLLSSEKL